MKTPESMKDLYGPGVEIAPRRRLTTIKDSASVPSERNCDLLKADRLFGEQVRRENNKIHTKILRRMLGRNSPIDADPG